MGCKSFFWRKTGYSTGASGNIKLKVKFQHEFWWSSISNTDLNICYQELTMGVKKETWVRYNEH